MIIMNKNIWHILLVTIIICTYCNIRAAAEDNLPIIPSIKSITRLSKPSDVPEKFRFADDVIIEFFDQWSEEDITHYSSTPLQVALNGEKLAIKNHWERVNKINMSHPLLEFKVFKNLQFPLEQATRIIEHLLSTKKASANEKHTRPFFTTNSPLHNAQHPEHVALLIEYGGDLRAQNGSGHTPLEEAIDHDYWHDKENMQLTKAFLEGGAPVIADNELRAIIYLPKKDESFFKKMVLLLDQYRK